MLNKFLVFSVIFLTATTCWAADSSPAKVSRSPAARMSEIGKIAAHETKLQLIEETKGKLGDCVAMANAVETATKEELASRITKRCRPEIERLFFLGLSEEAVAEAIAKTLNER
jgi:hypothetical protein